MNSSTRITKLWDFGWLDVDNVPIFDATDEEEYIKSYIDSKDFQTSFQPGHDYLEGIHGPFKSNTIQTTDFLKYDENDFLIYIEQIRYLKDFSEPPDESQWNTLLHYFHGCFAKKNPRYILRYDEENKELFHEWGGIYFVFREIQFIDVSNHNLERILLGYD